MPHLQWLGIRPSQVVNFGIHQSNQILFTHEELKILQKIVISEESKTFSSETLNELKSMTRKVELDALRGTNFGLVHSIEVLIFHHFWIPFLSL